MANWKKMAEAFGRALNRPDIRNQMNTFGKNSKQGVKDRTKLFDDMEMSANKASKGGVEFYEGWDHGERGATRVGSREPHPDELDREQKAFDELTEQRMDNRLQRDFDRVVDEIAGDDDNLRRQLIDELKNGTDISDIRKRYGNDEREWNDAFDKAKARIKRDYGPDYPEDMAEEGAQTFEDQLRDVIDEVKSQGRSVEDILDALKSMGEK